jgi:hypothetical protein
MKRWLTSAAALVTVASIAATLGAAATKPYVGTWKARVTADQLLDNGIAQPQFKGVWKLTLMKDGTYRTYNPWDKWSSGTYSANATRIVLSKDVQCLRGGLKGPGLYRWSVKAGKLKLTSVAIGSDPCGGRWQTVSIPLWTRA